MQTNDRPLSSFASDDEAYEYAAATRACVYDDNMQCVYCRRWDH